MSARETCYKCGSPALPNVRPPMCDPCRRQYNRNAKARVGERRRKVEETYARLGLEPGKVWAKVLR